MWVSLYKKNYYIIFRTKCRKYVVLFDTATTRIDAESDWNARLKRKKPTVSFIFRYITHPGYIMSICFQLTRFNDSFFVSHYLLHVVHPCHFGLNLPERLPRTARSPNHVSYYIRPLIFLLLSFVSSAVFLSHSPWLPSTTQKNWSIDTVRRFCTIHLNFEGVDRLPLTTVFGILKIYQLITLTTI